MDKEEGAFLTIGEVANALGLPQHILRYWETRFPQLRPLQRAGNRRYYRPADVELVKRINQLLNVEGFTMKGAQKALAAKGKPAAAAAVAPGDGGEGAPAPALASVAQADMLARLEHIRAQLARALGA